MLLLGMVVGTVGGFLMGTVLVCCLVAGKEDDCRMEELYREERRRKKYICFPDAEGKEAFSICDGESICMTSDDGETHASLCRYVDETHVEIDGKLWELSAFARRMQEIGIAYEPFS